MAIKILLVEDSRILRDRLRALVAGIPNAAMVDEADSEETARQCIGSCVPEVVVLDLRLKSGSGLAVLEHLKTVAPRAVAIVLTNYSQPEYRQKCAQLGADYFFDKSQDIDTFAQLLAGMASEDSSGRHLSSGSLGQARKEVFDE